VLKRNSSLLVRIVVVASALSMMTRVDEPIFGQAANPIASVPQKVIIDTDIGNDIDDAFALALALSSKNLNILGITTSRGDTDLRARLVERFLKQTGREDIQVAAGTHTPSRGHFTQAPWAEGFPEPAHGWPNATDFTLDAIRHNPGEITLISLAPLTNVAALIDKDPATFRLLKRVVMMGGSIRYGYNTPGASWEYNIATDIPAAKKLFASTVPIDMMPLDSTVIHLDGVRRFRLLSAHTPKTDVLRELYREWARYPHNVTPTLYDAMTVAAVVNPALCPTTPMRIRIDDVGFTRIEDGTPNANVCLQSNPDDFFHFYYHQLLPASRDWSTWDSILWVASYFAALGLRR